jgi:hypothetical protein
VEDNMPDLPIDGTWRVTGSTDGRFRRDARVSFTDSPEGLRIRVAGGPEVTVRWSTAEYDGGPDSQGALATGAGVIWLAPEPGAFDADLAQAVEGRRPAGGPPPLDHRDFPAGDGQVLVLYQPLDSGDEIDPEPLLAAVATDAAQRSAEGWSMSSIMGMPLRHAGVKLLGVEGSGYTTKAALGVLYLRTAAGGSRAGLDPRSS